MARGLTGPRVRGRMVRLHELVALETCPVHVCKHCRQAFGWEELAHSEIPLCTGVAP